MDKLKFMNEIILTFYLICAGPILAYLAYKGLGQLSIAKKNIKIMSQRDAFKLAGEQCQVFAEKIVPLFANFRKELSEAQCDLLENFEVKIEKNGLRVKPIKEIPESDWNVVNSSKYLTDLLNYIEGFSLYFASGVAAEKVGYLTCGRGYCELVRKLAPFFIVEFKKGYFKNTSMLLFAWSNLCNVEDIKLKQSELQKELKNTTVVEVPTIGCD